MFSSEREKVDFSQPISTSAARGAVEKWLLQVEEVMTVSVKDVIQSAKEVRITFRIPQDICLTSQDNSGYVSFISTFT